MCHLCHSATSVLTKVNAIFHPGLRRSIPVDLDASCVRLLVVEGEYSEVGSAEADLCASFNILDGVGPEEGAADVSHDLAVII